MLVLTVEEKAHFNYWSLFLRHIVRHFFLAKRQVTKVCKVQAKSAKIMKEKAFFVAALYGQF